MLDSRIYPARDPVVIDARSGKIIQRGLGILPGEWSLSDSFGGKFYEWWNPDVVQREYDLQAGTPGVGREAPHAPTVTLADVMQAGRDETMQRFEQAGEMLKGAAKLALGAGAIALLLYGLNTYARLKGK